MVQEGRATIKSDIDCLTTLEIVRTIPEEYFVLPGGADAKLDCYYIEPWLKGYMWANAVSNPKIDNPMKPGWHGINLLPATFTGARIITPEDLLDMNEEICMGIVPDIRGLPWIHPTCRYSGQAARRERDELMLMYSEQEGLTQRQIAEMFLIDQSNVARALRRIKLLLT